MQKDFFFFRRLLCVGDWCVYVSLFHNAIKHTRDIMQFLIMPTSLLYRTIAEEMMPSRLKIELNKIEPIILCANRLRANNV